MQDGRIEASRKHRVKVNPNHRLSCVPTGLLRHGAGETRMTTMSSQGRRLNRELHTALPCGVQLESIQDFIYR